LISVVVLAGLVDLTDEQCAELRKLTNSPGVAATVATRAWIMLWHNEGRQKKDLAALACQRGISGWDIGRVRVHSHRSGAPVPDIV